MSQYLMHPTYATYALQQLVADKQILVVVERAPERRMIMQDLLAVIPEDFPVEARWGNGAESIRMPHRRGMGRITIMRSDPYALRGHVADLAMLPPGVGKDFEYELGPVLISRSGSIEFYSRDAPRP